MGDEIFPEDAAGADDGDAPEGASREPKKSNPGELKKFALGSAAESVIGVDPFDAGKAADMISAAATGEPDPEAPPEKPAAPAKNPLRDQAFPPSALGGRATDSSSGGPNPAEGHLRNPKGAGAGGSAPRAGRRAPFGDQLSRQRGSGLGSPAGKGEGAGARLGRSGKEALKDFARDKALKAAASYAGVPPQAVDRLKRLANSDSMAGRALRRTPLLGRALKGSRTTKKEQRTTSANDKTGGSGEAKGKAAKLAIGCSPAIAFAVIILMLLLAIVGGELANASGPVQPDKKSDKKVMKYLPKGWYKVLKDAADTTSGQPEYAVVPWTILAGIVAHQTDFGRYSPYDDADRDPGRDTPPLPYGGGGGGGTENTGDDAIVVGPTNGAGPGPVKGVTGTGNAADVGGGHPGPPAGNLSEQLGWFLWALRTHESNGNYKEPPNATAGAAGAYQYTEGTWNNYKGYPTANVAPAAIQDERVIKDTLRHWNQYHRWQKVAMAHFYPVWANSPGQWGGVPAPGNPTGWGYVDDVMRKMRTAAEQYPPSGGNGGSSASPSATPAMAPAPPGLVTVEPAALRPAEKPSSPTPSSSEPSGKPSGEPSAKASSATPSSEPATPSDDNGCEVDPPKQAIGGQKEQGVGPFLLTPAAAAEMTAKGQDPQSPCAAAKYVARRLATAARDAYGKDKTPQWKPEGDKQDKENARKYWSLVIDQAGTFMDKSWKPGQPCELPPEQPDKPHSISYKIIYIWHCQFVRAGDLYLVTDVKTADKKKPEYVTETDRSAAEQQLIDEAMDVSYAAGKWETKDCKKDSDERQGIFPMTKDEAAAGGAQDRCDAVQNISTAAKLVLSEEVVPPDDRPKDLGPYQPMAGGWQKLGIALGERLRTFATYGPGNHHETNAACTQAIDAFLDAIGPKAGDFASLTDPPGKKRLPDWTVKLSTLETTGNIADPDTAEPCREVALTTGYDLAISQQAVAHANTADDAGNKSLSANLNGLANYYEAKGDSFAPQTPKPGSDSLVIPRLTPTPLQEIRPPIDDDARTAWSNVGTTSGVGIPLSQRAVEYAWFFGGVIAEFDSAGQIIGSLGSGVGNTGENTGTGQSEVGPDGCPVSTPPNTLRDGAAKIGIQKLCAEAVANAATPAAAKAIKWALARLGWHYCLCAKRNEVGWADCSSFVSRAYQEGAGMHLYQGNALTVTPYHVGNHPWRRLIPFSQIQAGDLMVVNSGGHIAMQLVDGYKVHTNTHNDVSRIERTYSPSYVEATVRMIPEGA